MSETGSSLMKRDKAESPALKHCRAFSSIAIKVEPQFNESRHWGLCSLCCVLCPLLMASRCGLFHKCGFRKTFPHINPISSDPAHDLATETAQNGPQTHLYNQIPRGR